MTREETPATQRQIGVLRVIFCFIEREGWAPTVRELMPLVGVGHPQSVQGFLNCLARKGLIKKSTLKGQAAARAMCVTMKGRLLLKGVFSADFPDEVMSKPEELVHWAYNMQIDNGQLRKELEGKHEAVCVQMTLGRTFRKKHERAAKLRDHYFKENERLRKELEELKASNDENKSAAKSIDVDRSGDRRISRRPVGRIFCAEGESDSSRVAHIQPRRKRTVTEVPGVTVSTSASEQVA